jgi:hypothetical protein
VLVGKHFRHTVKRAMADLFEAVHTLRRPGERLNLAAATEIVARVEGLNLRRAVADVRDTASSCLREYERGYKIQVSVPIFSIRFVAFGRFRNDQMKAKIK